MKIIDNVTVVIRSVGERTERLCKELVMQQGVNGGSVFIVHEHPFSKALSASFELGIREGKDWTFCVDADLLLRAGSIETMIGHFDGQPKNVCEIQGFIIDKFFGGPRVGGIHMYRTTMLHEVKKSIPDEGLDIRPEARTLKTMKEKGYPYVIVPYIVGLHDFEQEYSDILRKSFIYSKKHIMYASLFSRFWSANAKNDQDYVYALEGFSLGFKNVGQVFIDQSKDYVSNSTVPKKDPLGITEWNNERVEEVISSFRNDAIFNEVFPIPFLGISGPTRLKTVHRQLKVLEKQLGFLGAFLFIVSAVLKKFSDLIKKSIL